MKCPYCGDEESKVIDSRPTEDSERIRRRRECLNCHMRFTTYEVVETVPLIVIKKDNSREPLDRQKLLNAMLRACAQRFAEVESFFKELKKRMGDRKKSSGSKAISASFSAAGQGMGRFFVHAVSGREGSLGNCRRCPI